MTDIHSIIPVTNPRTINLTGIRFERWVVLGFLGQARWLCLCDCGTRKTVAGPSLRRGDTTSCGCRQKEIASATNGTHHLSQHPLYGTWKMMIDRCDNPNNSAYRLYGERGVKVCERWYNIHAFLADVGERPSPKHSLDRIDNDGDYCPENCTWATQKEQTSHTSKTRYITALGRTQTITEWANEYHLSKSTIYDRLARGWSVDDAVSRPVPMRPQG